MLELDKDNQVEIVFLWEIQCLLNTGTDLTLHSCDKLRYFAIIFTSTDKINID